MRKKDREILKCRRCGFSKECNEDVDRESYKISTEIQHSATDQIEIVRGSDVQTMPTTRAECPKCGHKEAAYWQLQTRSADEGMTTFYRCLKCKHTWRAY